MSTRLRTKEQRERATKELLGILAEYPGGVATSELRGTPQFHGTHTLSNRQIIHLLRESGRVTEHTGGQGARTFSFWMLNPNRLSGSADVPSPRAATGNRKRGSR